jgi:hypothetical protein
VVDELVDVGAASVVAGALVLPPPPHPATSAAATIATHADSQM